MKILISIHTLAVGGAQTFTVRLSNALSQEHDVYLYVHNPRGNGNDLIGLISEKVKVHQLLLPSVLDWIAWKINRLITFFVNDFSFHDFLNGWYFRKFLGNLKPDLINSHMIGSDQFVAKHSRNIPWVISMHGCYEIGLAIEKNFIQRAQRILKDADALIYAADKNLDILSAINNPGLLVRRKKIYYGINDQPLPKKERAGNRLVFGMVARSISSKGWVQALSAFSELRKNYRDRDLEFLVIADESEFYKELLRKFSNTDGIRFLGFRLNPGVEISEMDVCVLPTFFSGESLPNSVIEYLMAGKPVITTDIGEIANMVTGEGKIAGYLIPLREATGQVHSNDIMQCMECYVKDSQLLSEHQVVARKAFAKFSIERCVSDYVDFFCQTMRTKGVSNSDETLKS